MNFIQVEKEVKKIHNEFKVGLLSESDFRSRLFDMMIQDKAGEWWMVSYKSGQWHRYDGYRWLPDLHPLRKSQLLKSNAWWLLGISVLLLLPTFGLSIIGIISSIGMLMNQEWGRKGNVFYLLLIEVAGLITAISVVFILSAGGVSYYDSELYWFIAIASLFSFSSGAIFATRLIRLGAVTLDKKTRLQRPSGVLPVAIPLLFTILGTVPALGLLLKKTWGKTSTIYTLGFLIGASILSTIVAAPGMQAYNYNYDEYWHNEWGIAIAVVVTIVIVIWCIVAIRYLMHQRVNEWLNDQ